MIFEWFNTEKATIIGVKLADSLSVDLAKINNKNLKKQMEPRAKAMQKIFVQVDQFKQTNNLNFYKKSKLANEFRWRLLEIGYGADFVDILTKQLVLHINR